MWVDSTTTALRSYRNPVTMRVSASLSTLTCSFSYEFKGKSKNKGFWKWPRNLYQSTEIFHLKLRKRNFCFLQCQLHKRLETLVNTLLCEDLFSIVNLRVNIGTLVQNGPNRMKSNDFFCTKTCTDLYQNSQICTEMTQLVRPISA